MSIFCIIISYRCKPSPQKQKESNPDLFADNIRVTDFQTPEQERAGFTLPEGFEITLFASEPDISKPINMEFDARGRLWVTNTVEYPMPARDRKGKDRITILEDTDGDGRADKFTNFTDEMNIPIGITPVHRGAIAYSIPNVYRFTDNDDDGKADDSTKLVGPFEFIDTHGMVNNLIRGYDGWIHACHGYANTSTVAGKDGDSITMNSGNTFRFREDGSRVEATTYGRINPFGYAYDDWGYLYSLDCHTKPIYQLIHNAQYPAQGGKQPAFGWAPEMMSYEFGSTANSGLVYYTGGQFPEAYQHNFYSGNVVTGRINRNTMSLEGSSPVSKREEDFVISADPWFRPVDLKTGPDGSIYIADFYNRIIGHYEVPKEHPGRDRTSGRIWKITYKGKDVKKITPRDWSKASLDELIKALNYPQLNIRMLIANQIVDVHQSGAVVPVKQHITSPGIDHQSLIQGLWILYRLNALDADILNKALQHTEPVVQVHALRILTETVKITPQQYQYVLEAMQHADARVRRMATEVLAKFPQYENLALLMQVHNSAPEKDSHLKYTILLALRDHLRDAAIIKKVALAKWDEAQLAMLMKVIPEVPLQEAALFALEYLQTHSVSAEQQVTYMGYVGRYVPAAKLDKAITLIRKNLSGNMDIQYMVYQTVRQGVAQKGEQVSAAVRQWGAGLASQVLEHHSDSVDVWRSRFIDRKGEPEEPWRVSDNFLTDVIPAFRIIHSEARGYEPMSVLHSVPFKIPATLSMNIFDYDVHNTKERKGISKNVVRIRLYGSNKIISEYRLHQKELSERKDIIKPDVPFDLKQWAGQQGYIEVVDSSKTSAVGIGNLKPAVLPIPAKGIRELSERRIQAIEIAADYKLKQLIPALQKIAGTEWMNYKVRIAAANALMHISPMQNIIQVGAVYNNLDEMPALRKGFAQALGQSSSPEVYAILEKGLQGSDYTLQLAAAALLAGNTTGINHLLNAVKEGNLPAAIVTEIPVKEALSVNMRGGQQKELEKLTAGGVNERAERDKIIESRLKGFEASAATAEAGRNIFVLNCSMCHQVKGEGGMIGPQLEGIGNWGPRALAEKVLDPNRNISSAFRTYNITLKNGKTQSGLYRRTEGEVMVFANPSGEEFSIPQADIKESKPSKYTLMPDQFRNSIPEQDFYALLKYLLSIKE